MNSEQADDFEAESQSSHSLSDSARITSQNAGYLCGKITKIQQQDVLRHAELRIQLTKEVVLRWVEKQKGQKKKM